MAYQLNFLEYNISVVLFIKRTHTHTHTHGKGSEGERREDYNQREDSVLLDLAGLDEKMNAAIMGYESSEIRNPHPKYFAYLSPDS